MKERDNNVSIQFSSHIVDMLIKKLKEKISIIATDLLNDFPVELYIFDISKPSRHRRFNYLSPSSNDKLEKIESRYGQNILALFHKLTLAILIKASLKKLAEKNLPRSVNGLYIQWFDRVIKDLSKQSDNYFHHNNVLFIKDLAVCRLKAIPVGGAWLVEIGRIGRKSLIFGGGIKQFIRYFRTVVLHTRGIRPFYIVHVFERYMPRFSAEELEKSYYRIAELMKSNNKIKGIYRGSWLLDPQLSEISPHLVFNRTIPEQNGAEFFRAGRTPLTVKNAIAVSPKRRQYYEEGKYLPTNYSYIWPRKRFLRWAESQKFVI